MPKPRSSQVSLQDTPYYHCVSRCVRRAFLCGTDPLSGNCYEHRRDWVATKLLELPRYFAISICAYAVMSNHTHVVLRVDQEQAGAWSIDEVIERWHGLFSGTSFSQRYLAGQALHDAELNQLRKDVEKWRERLTSISWFMRCLNESIARQANEEDQCTGRFWEGRFKSQALLDEAALAACLAYVDLNPVRAAMAETPESSDYTSVQRRFQCLQAGEQTQPDDLDQFVGNPRAEMPPGLPFALNDYLQLVDWTGRAIREDKRGAISGSCPPILERLNISDTAWLQLTTELEQQFSNSIGREQSTRKAADQRQCRWIRGIGSAKRLFDSA